MKQIKSINRAIKRGTLLLRYNSATQSHYLVRRTNKGNWVIY